MKKVFSLIFLVLSIMLITLVTFVGALCIYDIKIYSSGAFAGSFDMWYALRDYPRFLLPASFIGILTNTMYIMLSPKADKKIFKTVICVFFAVMIIASFVLRYFCYRDF